MMYFARWKVVLILAVLTLGTIFAFPTCCRAASNRPIPGLAAPSTVSLGPRSCRAARTCCSQADTTSLVHERLGTVVDDFRATLRKANIGYSDIGIKGNAAVVKLLDPTKHRHGRARPRSRRQGHRFCGLGRWAGLRFAQRVAVARPWCAPPWRIRSRSCAGASMPPAPVEPTIQRQGSDRILLELPGLSDPETGQGSDRQDREDDLPPRRSECHAGADPDGHRSADRRSAAAGLGAERGREARSMSCRSASWSAAKISRAHRQRRTRTASGWSPSPSIPGGKKFCDVTTANVNKPFAIVLDNKVISAPNIREAICGGSGRSAATSPRSPLRNWPCCCAAVRLPVPAQDHRRAHGRSRSRRRFDSRRRLCLHHRLCCWSRSTWCWPMACSACSPTSRCCSTSS